MDVLESQKRRRFLLTATAGTLVTALGASASFFGQELRANQEILSYAAGAIIIAMGLHFIGVFKIGLLYREKRAEIEKPMGLFGATLRSGSSVLRVSCPAAEQTANAASSGKRMRFMSEAVVEFAGAA